MNSSVFFIILLTTFFCWVNAVSYGTTWKMQFDAGDYHFLVRDRAGRMFSWGSNTYGQLGKTLTYSYPYSPKNFAIVELENMDEWKFVTTGDNFCVVAHSNGDIYTWGKNDVGQLGDTTTTNKEEPNKISPVLLAGKTIQQIAAGSRHVLVLDSNGIVYSWGANDQGQLGDNTTVDKLTAVLVYTAGVLSGKKIARVAAGYDHSMALDTDGYIYLWGGNLYGQLGDNTYASKSIPISVTLGPKIVTDIAVGNYFSYAFVGEYQEIWSWGYGDYGQLSNNQTFLTNGGIVLRNVPKEINYGNLRGKSISKIFAKKNNAYALDSNGNLYGWGYNVYYQLGSTNTYEPLPTNAIHNGQLAGKKVVAVTASVGTSLIMDSDLQFYAIGNNANGEFAIGTTFPKNSTTVIKTNCLEDYNNTNGICRPVCNSAISDLQTTCSKHGACWGLDYCKCDSFYFGKWCEVTTCYGVSSNMTQTCSGNGNCTLYNTCSCKSGYIRQDCGVMSCFGVPDFDTNNVCSGNGNCTASNTCTCKTGYVGTNCDSVGCFGIAFSDSTVCSGHGTCVGLDSCSCSSGYKGDRCQTGGAFASTPKLGLFIFMILASVSWLFL